MSNTRMSRHLEADAGSASPVAAALVAILVIIALAVAQAGALVVAGARADAAADLAALGAARTDRDRRALGASSPAALRAACGTAREVAELNGARVTSCVRGPEWSVRVTVAVGVRSWPVPVVAEARAGPAIPSG